MSAGPEGWPGGPGGAPCGLPGVEGSSGAGLPLELADCCVEEGDAEEAEAGAAWGGGIGAERGAVSAGVEAEGGCASLLSGLREGASGAWRWPEAGCLAAGSAGPALSLLSLLAAG